MLTDVSLAVLFINICGDHTPVNEAFKRAIPRDHTASHVS